MNATDQQIEQAISAVERLSKAHRRIGELERERTEKWRERRLTQDDQDARREAEEELEEAMQEVFLAGGILRNAAQTSAKEAAS